MLKLLAQDDNTLLTVHQIQSKNPDEPIETLYTYEAHLTILRTGKHHTRVYDNENDAVRFFHFWITRSHYTAKSQTT